MKLSALDHRGGFTPRDLPGCFALSLGVEPENNEIVLGKSLLVA